MAHRSDVSEVEKYANRSAAPPTSGRAKAAHHSEKAPTVPDTAAATGAHDGFLFTAAVLEPLTADAG